MLKIQLFQDTVCPWCRIGKKNLETALKEWGNDQFEITYHAFFLNSQVPESGMDFRQYMTRLKGDSHLEPLFDGVKAAGQRSRLTFNFDKIHYYPNTVLSHQLIYLTPDDRKGNMIDAVTKAYFEDGIDIGNRESLIQIAVENGWDETEIRRHFDSDKIPIHIVNEDVWARQNGISGVPFFIIGKYGFSGAQPPNFILNVLKKAWEEQEKENQA